MFGLGFGELVAIFVVALLVFGPKRLPELARTLGKSLNEFRRASNDLRRSILEADAPEAATPPRGPADEVAAAALPAPAAAKMPAESAPGKPPGTTTPPAASDPIA